MKGDNMTIEDIHNAVQTASIKIPTPQLEVMEPEDEAVQNITSKEQIERKLSTDGDLRSYTLANEELLDYEVIDNDNLGFYQRAAEFLCHEVDAIEKKRAEEVARGKELQEKFRLEKTEHAHDKMYLSNNRDAVKVLRQEREECKAENARLRSMNEEPQSGVCVNYSYCGIPDIKKHDIAAAAHEDKS